MEGGLIPKQVLQQLTGHAAVQSGARFDHIVQQVLPLKDHQRPHLVPGQVGVSLAGLVDGGVHLLPVRPAGGKHQTQAAAAHPLQKAADLGLKQHHQHQNSPLNHPVQQKAGGGEGQYVIGGDKHCPQQDQHAPQHPAGAGLAQHPEQFVDDKGQNGDIQKVGQLNLQQREGRLPEHLKAVDQFCHMDSPHFRVWCAKYFIMVLYDISNGLATEKTNSKMKIL